MRTKLLLLAPAIVVLLSTGAVGVGTATALGASHQQRWNLDPTFGDGGIVRTDFPIAGGHYAWAFDNVVQPDGRIVVAGVSSSQVDQNDRAAVARYLPNGKLDPSFGNGGRVLIGPHALYRPTTVALQHIAGQYKILLAVKTTYFNPTRYRCSVIRLNADGSLDSDHDADPAVSFGHDGIEVVRFPGNSGFCGGLVLAPDGTIVVTVEASAHGGDVGVFRLLGSNGLLDPSFGSGGKMTISAPGFQVADAVTLQPGASGDPRIVVGGLVAGRHGYDWALWRITSDGTPDRTFGKDGRVVTAMRDAQVETSYDTVDTLTVTSAGNIVAGGRYRAWPEGEPEPQDTAAVAEYLPDGLLDKSFGTRGVTHIPWSPRGDTETADLTLDGSGRILFAGPFEMPTSGMFLVGGFTADGRRDRAFGSAGFTEFVVGGGYDAAESLSLESGRLVVAGISGDPGEGGHDRFGVTRLRLPASDGW